MVSPKIGNTMAIVFTRATVMAVSDKTDQPNQNNIDAMKPANGPNASLIYA